MVEALRRSLKVLVVDDDRDTADLIAEFLKMGGHRGKALYCGKTLKEAPRRSSRT